MKKTYIYIFSFLFLSLFACEDQLDQAPISEIGSNEFYQDEDDFEQAINGVYAALKAYPERQYYLSEVRSDNLLGVSNIGAREYEPINNFSTAIETNSIVEDAWEQNFSGIMSANTVLDKLNETVVPDQETRERMEGEAKFLRAVYYFNLVRWFGKLPIYTTFVSPEEAVEIPRSAVADVYNEVIIPDLKDAITLLSPAYSAGEQGRATSWAAKAMLAKVYLTMSGPTYGIEGPGLGVEMYDEALTLLNDVIDNGPFGWVENYAEIFSYNNEGNPDIVFDIQYISGGLGAGALYPGLMIPEAYGRIVLPFPPGGLEVIEVTESLMEAWPEGDVREEVTVLPGYTDDAGVRNNQPFYDKFLDVSMVGDNRFDWPINFPVIRFTDVLMMKAEAILQGAPGAQQEVDDIVNKVRERAGLEGDWSNVTLEMLVEERRREFAAEGSRWHTLVRTGLVLDVMNAWLPVAEASESMPDVMLPEWIIYPIPDEQLLVKKGLYTQNKGY